MAPLIRLLTPADLPHLLALSTSAGWNQTPADWSRMLQLEPEGCFGMEVDRCIVSSATLVTYGRRLAWLGMVLTLPEFRGRGFASRLLAHALHRADTLRIPSVRLDATDLGRPVYEKLGFRGDYEVQRWRRDPQPAAPPCSLPAAVPALWQTIDPPAFGADRQALLAHLAATAASAAVPEGYAFARPGRLASHFGPAVASTPGAAAALLQWFLSHHGTGSCFWDLRPGNHGAAGLAREHGFTPARTLLRMTHGQPCETRPSSSILALAGFEWG